MVNARALRGFLCLFLKVPTSSAEKCWASAADPPLPNIAVILSLLEVSLILVLNCSMVFSNSMELDINTLGSLNNYSI